VLQEAKKLAKYVKEQVANMAEKLGIFFAK
jgi:hypothetical protein